MSNIKNILITILAFLGGVFALLFRYKAKRVDELKEDLEIEKNSYKENVKRTEFNSKQETKKKSLDTDIKDFNEEIKVTDTTSTDTLTI